MAAAKKTVKPKREYLSFGGANTNHFSVTVDDKLLTRIDAAAKAAKVTRSRWLVEAAIAQLPVLTIKKKK